MGSAAKSRKTQANRHILEQQINIAGSGGHLTVSVRGYERPTRTGDDPEWLSCAIDCSVGPFRCDLELPLAVEDIRRFRASLAGALARLSGNAKMQTIEGRIGIEASMSSGGRAMVAGTLDYHPGPEATLIFKFESDQSYLVQSLAETDLVLAAFPERGAVPPTGR